jgi:hypothetical protein
MASCLIRIISHWPLGRNPGMGRLTPAVAKKKTRRNDHEEIYPKRIH